MLAFGVLCKTKVGIINIPFPVLCSVNCRNALMYTDSEHINCMYRRFTKFQKKSLVIVKHQLLAFQFIINSSISTRWSNYHSVFFDSLILLKKKYFTKKLKYKNYYLNLVRLPDGCWADGFQVVLERWRYLDSQFQRKRKRCRHKITIASDRCKSFTKNIFKMRPGSIITDHFSHMNLRWLRSEFDVTRVFNL